MMLWQTQRLSLVEKKEISACVVRIIWGAHQEAALHTLQLLSVLLQMWHAQVISAHYWTMRALKLLQQGLLDSSICLKNAHN